MKIIITNQRITAKKYRLMKVVYHFLNFLCKATGRSLEIVLENNTFTGIKFKKTSTHPLDKFLIDEYQKTIGYE